MNSIPRCLVSLAAVSAAFAPAMAQDLTLASAIVQRKIVAEVLGPGASQQAPVLAAGTDVAAGFSRSAGIVGANVVSTGSFQFQDQTFSAQVYADCIVNGAVVPGGEARSGDPAVVVNLALPCAMPLRFVLGAATVASAGAPAGRVVVDIGNDGSVELAFTSPTSVCANVTKSLVLDLPAGIVSIRMQAVAELPGHLVGSCLVSAATASLEVSAAHVQMEFSGTPCGAYLSATAMLDGQSVRFGVGPFANTVGWLVFGLQPAQVTLPLAPGCPLLVVPEVMVAASGMAWTTLPLAHLGPLDVQVQGVMLQPASPWLPGGLHSSERATLHVR